MTSNARVAKVPQPTRRAAERHRLTIPGRLTWRDNRGMTRFASVTTRDVSESGVYLESHGSDPIPLFRLVYLQLDRTTRDIAGLPAALKTGRVLSAVYRIGPCEPATGAPSGYALRLLIEPIRGRLTSNVGIVGAVHPESMSPFAPSLEVPTLEIGGELDLDGIDQLLV
jgi:hypothetical protein